MYNVGRHGTDVDVDIAITALQNSYIILLSLGDSLTASGTETQRYRITVAKLTKLLHECGYSE